ncbi:hypothetical protein F0919_04540 [Taibaiella lutea]|uniref:Uncharacterized protein n=1 Tax=Taibaiella lutea TaxID=2608001 RepID=A0A5M6CPL0_9BACT|nr:hypothetical protein [Taibaiella lutea]KAA5536946.1 hypothetical protein F0919_04540 [Taibaiella lutea]
MLLQNKSLLIITALALAISCNKIKHSDPVPPPPCVQPEDTCDFWSPSAGLVSISGPATASIGQTVQLIIGVTGNNGCADAAQVSAIATGNSISLTGNVHYHGCICTQALTEETALYNFTPAQAGTYTFHGTTYEGAPVVHTIVVQ